MDSVACTSSPSAVALKESESDARGTRFSGSLSPTADLGLCLYNTDPLKLRRHHQPFVRPIKAKPPVALREQNFYAGSLARSFIVSVLSGTLKVASTVSPGFLIRILCLLAVPVLIGGCSVRPRAVPKDASTQTDDESSDEAPEDPSKFKIVPTPCTYQFKDYCHNGGTCYLHKNIDQRWYPYCYCTDEWGGRRCNVRVDPDMFAVKLPELEIAAMSTIVVLIIALAIICSSGLYFYRRHLKDKAANRYSFITRSPFVSSSKNIVVKYKTGADFQCPEQQPLASCEQALDDEEKPRQKIRRFLSV